MTERARTLCWGSPRMFERLRDRIARRLRTVLRLPSDFHVVLSDCLYGKARPRINATGDVRLLGRIARVEALRELAVLDAAMVEARTRLRVVSPAPHLVFTAPPLVRVRWSGSARLDAALRVPGEPRQTGVLGA